MKNTSKRKHDKSTGTNPEYESLRYLYIYTSTIVNTPVQVSKQIIFIAPIDRSCDLSSEKHGDGGATWTPQRKKPCGKMQLEQQQKQQHQ